MRRHSPDAAAELERDTRAHNYAVEAFNALVGEYGYSDRNLADIAAAHLIVNWIVAHDAEDPSRRQYASIQAQFRSGLLGDSTLRGYDDAKKQTIADDLLLRCIILAAVRAELRRQPDSDAQRAALAKATREDARESGGIDLDALELTAEGFRGAR